MQTTGLLAATASSDGGDAVVGFIIIAGLVWFICWLFSSRESTYDVDIKRHTFGTVKKRR